MDTDKLRQDRIDAWAQVRAVFTAADELVREAKRLRVQLDVSPETSGPAAADAAEVRGQGAPKSYVRRREALRVALKETLKPALGRYIGQMQANHCLVPLVIAIDERERLALDTLAKRWSLPALQTQLLEIDDGGDRFFDQLDEHLNGRGLHPLVFELYLICLKGGFSGRYQGRDNERQAFETRLVERIRNEDPRRALASAPGVTLPEGGSVEAEKAAAAEARRRKVTFLPFPYRYYLGVVGVMLALFVVLRIRSNKEVTRSPIGCACSESAQDDPERCLGTGDAH